MLKVFLSLTLGAVALILLPLATSNTANACSFNCNKSPKLNASGFTSKQDGLAPYANGYKGDTPSVIIPNAEDAKIVLWLHGQYNPRRKEKCAHPDNMPPKSILQLDEAQDTHIYYHCTSVIDLAIEKDNRPDDGIHYTYGYAMGSYTLARRDELELLIDSFLTVGVQPKNIVVAGHSAGGWTSLLAAASYPEKFGSLIAFAPAFAGTRRDEKQYPWWRQIIRPEQVEMIKKSNGVRKLIFAYENDKYNRPSDLAFIEEFFPDTANVVAQKCGHGHMSHKNDCNADATVNMINEFVAR